MKQELKNIVATYGDFVVTEEVNCYVIWQDDSLNVMPCNGVPFEDDKDQAFKNAKEYAIKRIK